MRTKLHDQIEEKQEELYRMQQAFALDIKFIDDDNYEDEMIPQLLAMKTLKIEIRMLENELNH